MEAWKKKFRNYKNSVRRNDVKELSFLEEIKNIYIETLRNASFKNYFSNYLNWDLFVFLFNGLITYNDYRERCLYLLRHNEILPANIVSNHTSYIVSSISRARNWDSSFTLVTTLYSERLRNWISVPSKGWDYSLPHCMKTDPLAPPSLLSGEYQDKNGQDVKLTTDGFIKTSLMQIV